MVASPGSGTTGVSGQTKGSGSSDSERKKRSKPKAEAKSIETGKQKTFTNPDKLRNQIFQGEKGGPNISFEDYHNQLFDSISENKISKGEGALTLAEKQDYIDKSFDIKENPPIGGIQFNPEYALQRGFVPEGVPTLSQLRSGEVSGAQARASDRRASKEADLAQQVQTGAITPEQISSLSPTQQAELLEDSGAGLDFEQAAGAGAAAAVPGIVGGIATGAAAGAGFGAIGGPIGAGIGAVGGALVGGITAYLVGVRSNLKSQATQNISISKDNLTSVQTNLRALITDTNQNPGHAAENVQLFNSQLARLDKANSQLYLETRGNIYKFLGKDGRGELESFEIFNSPGGARELLVSNMQIALLNPDPTKSLITIEDIE